jgi:hypothetical protein
MSLSSGGGSANASQSWFAAYSISLRRYDPRFIVLFGAYELGLIVSMVMFALGEMATWLPLGEGFAGYASRFVDPGMLPDRE